MRMPIRTTCIKPSIELGRELYRLSQMAAAATLLGVTNLYNQAKAIYNNLIVSYNNRLPSEKKRKDFGHNSKLIKSIKMEIIILWNF